MSSNHNSNNHEHSTDGTASELIEIHDDEIPFYFVQRGTRLFSSNIDSPYPLPVDGPEQQRLNSLHIILKRTFGGNYVGPVRDILSPDDNRKKVVIDLGSGTGRWAVEMGRDFPLVEFYGFDIAPISTRYPPHNVVFQMQDINNSWGWGDSTVDMVHARSVSMAVHDFGDIAREAARVLRRGGLFLSCEWVRAPRIHPNLNLDVAAHVPRLCQFFSILQEALSRRRGIECLAGRVPQYLQRTQAFDEIVIREECIPLGPWAEGEGSSVLRTGTEMMECFLQYANSSRPLLIEAGHSPDRLDTLYREMRLEIAAKPGPVCTIHAVYARRL